MGTVFICFRWEQNCRTAFWTYFTGFWTCVMKASLQKASLISGATFISLRAVKWTVPPTCLETDHLSTLNNSYTEHCNRWYKWSESSETTKAGETLVLHNHWEFYVIFKGSCFACIFHWEHQITMKQMQHMKNRAIRYKTDYYLQWQRVFPQLEACSQHLLILHNLRVLYPWWRHRVSLDHACVQHQSQKQSLHSLGLSDDH